MAMAIHNTARLRTIQHHYMITYVLQSVQYVLLYIQLYVNSMYMSPN